MQIFQNKTKRKKKRFINYDQIYWVWCSLFRSSKISYVYYYAKIGSFDYKFTIALFSIKSAHILCWRVFVKWKFEKLKQWDTNDR